MRLNYEKELNTKILYYSAKNKLKLCNNTTSIQLKNNNENKGKKAKRQNYYYNKKAAI